MVYLVLTCCTVVPPVAQPPFYAWPTSHTTSETTLLGSCPLLSDVRQLFAGVPPLHERQRSQGAVAPPFMTAAVQVSHGSNRGSSVSRKVNDARLYPRLLYAETVLFLAETALFTAVMLLFMAYFFVIYKGNT
eukprot:3529325-Rhodomonas_salina.1